MKNLIASLFAAFLLTLSIAPSMAGESSAAAPEYSMSDLDDDGC
jgi:hypothetical protein